MTSSPAFETEKADTEFFQRHLADFVPPNAFDAHAHLYRAELQGTPTLGVVSAGPPAVGFDAFRELPRRWMGELAPRDGLCFGLPSANMDVAASNRFMQDEVSRGPDSRWLLVVRPGDDPAAMEAALRAPGCAGFKPYHCFAERDDTFDADLSEFLPEWAWELADAGGRVITLHMVNRRSLGHAANQEYLREHCLRYPRANLVLAHSGRGFNPRHLAGGLDALRGLDNVFFDTSAVCNPTAFEMVLRAFGPTRLMYGSDFPISELLATNVPFGEGFFWLYKDNAQYADQPQSMERPGLLGNESLLALRQACDTLGFGAGDVEQIFCHTARELLGISSRAERRTGERLYEEARQIFPGGTQLFGKRAENYAPGQWPTYFSEARGCETVDLDGRRYTDMSICGILATILGYADPDVTAAVNRRIHLGSMCTLNPPDEVELAKLLIEIHPWAEMVRLGRMGGETMAIAVRIARARTRRDKVALCGYHGWHDWYLAANLGDPNSLGGYHLLEGIPAVGVPRGLAGSTFTFNYNDLDELKLIVDQHGNDLAAVVMEPTRNFEPQPGFLEGARELADRCGARLIMDEISIGWRLCLGGAHLKLGIEPDMAVFAKTVGNGHPITAVIGNADTMQAAQDTFISSAFWTEAVGPAAGVAAVNKMMRIDVPAHLDRIGRRVRDGLAGLAAEHAVPLSCRSYPAITTFAFDHPKAAALQTLWTVRMLPRGFLVSPAFDPMLAHQDHHVDAYLAACDDVFAEMGAAIRKDDIEQRIGGPVKHAGFTRLA